MIAVDAQAMGMIRTPYEAVEMVCIANHDLAVNYVDDMADELEKHGKADEYLTAVELGDTARATSFIEELIEKERIREIFLTALKETREELGVPELDPKIRRAGTLDIDPGEEEDEFEDDDDLPDVVEPAFVRIAPWRFERHFELTGAGFWVALDAVRQSVIATPYEAVEMICNVNLMYSARSRQNTWRLIFDEYTPEELVVAIQNRTLSGFMERTAKSEKFETMVDDLMLEIRKKFGVPETEKRGKSEKYKLWAESRRKPVN